MPEADLPIQAITGAGARPLAHAHSAEPASTWHVPGVDSRVPRFRRNYIPVQEPPAAPAAPSSANVSGGSALPADPNSYYLSAAKPTRAGALGSARINEKTRAHAHMSPDKL